MRQLTPTEPHGHFDFVAFLDEFDHAAHFNIVVVVIDTGAQFDFFDFDDFLFFARFVLFLLLFVFVLAEVEDFTDWRVSVRRYLDEVETGIGCHGERFVAPDDTHHLAPLVDEAHANATDLVIDAGSLAGGSKV